MATVNSIATLSDELCGLFGVSPGDVSKITLTFSANGPATVDIEMIVWKNQGDQVVKLISRLVKGLGSE